MSTPDLTCHEQMPAPQDVMRIRTRYPYKRTYCWIAMIYDPLDCSDDDAGEAGDAGAPGDSGDAVKSDDAGATGESGDAGQSGDAGATSDAAI